MTLTAIFFPRRHALNQWQAAKARFEAAVKARDTREQREAWEALRRATVRKLKVGA